MTCSACSGTLEPSTYRGVRVLVCAACSGIHFRGYKGDAYRVVNFSRIGAGEGVRYFDLDMTGSNGRERVHGWIDAAGTMVQVG